MIFTAALLSQLVVTSPAIAVGVQGHVEQVTGGARMPVSRFDQIDEGAILITHKDSSAQLRFASGSLLRIGANSELSLDRLEHGTPAGKRRESLRLTAGRIWARVTKLFGNDSTFEVETDTAVAGVRGTSFMAEVQGTEGRFVLFEGAIDLLRDGDQFRLDQPGSFVRTTMGGFGQTGTLAIPELKNLQHQVGGVGGALVSNLKQKRQAEALSAAAQGDSKDKKSQREGNREVIKGPNQLVDSPTAPTSAVVQPPPPSITPPPPEPAKVNVVVTLPGSGD